MALGWQDGPLVKSQSQLKTKLNWLEVYKGSGHNTNSQSQLFTCMLMDNNFGVQWGKCSFNNKQGEPENKPNVYPTIST